jgi:hypothetical protein
MNSHAGTIELWKKRGVDDYGRKCYDDDQPADGMIRFTNLSPYHTPKEKLLLEQHWANAVTALWNPLCNFCSAEKWHNLNQPIDEIKDYFGV